MNHNADQFPDDNSEPLLFTEIRDVIESGHLHLLQRCVSDQAVYRARMLELKTEWMSVGEYIISDKFGLSYKIDPTTSKKYVPRPLPPLQQGQKELLLQENDFPYHFEKSVKHLLLWKLGTNAVVTEEDVRRSLEEVTTQCKITRTITTDVDAFDVVDYCYFINPPELKSVLDVSHAHIIVQTRPPTQTTAQTPAPKQTPAKDNSSSDTTKMMLWQCAKYSAWGAGAVGALFIGKYVHTLFRLRELQREVGDFMTNGSFNMIKALRIYIKYFVPFPLSWMYNYGLNMTLQYMLGKNNNQ